MKLSGSDNNRDRRRKPSEEIDSAKEQKLTGTKFLLLIGMYLVLILALLLLLLLL